MTLLTCAAARRRLGAFHDRELPVMDLIAVETHVQNCPPCAKELLELRSLADALRASAAPVPSEDWIGLQPGVIGRMRAEAHESLAARARRTFEDMHLVWIGLGSTAASLVCGGIVLSMLQFASPVREDSLARAIAAMAVVDAPLEAELSTALRDGVIAAATGVAPEEDSEAPLGSDLNPTRLDGLISAPSAVPGDRMMEATLTESSSGDELVLPLSMTVTREGRVLDVSVLTNDHHPRDVTSIVKALSRTRLQPAQGQGGPVAVNLVWLLAHTTVRGKVRS